MNINEKPIGIFDSGIGGLTVVKRIDEFLPNENVIYFGDTARVPYGTKSNDTVIEYARQDTEFLLKHDVKMIVVACNTVSSAAIGYLKANYSIPIIGMIEPGVKLALQKTGSGRIGVIGTNATINNRAYSSELIKENSLLEVHEKACPLFVPLAEEGWISHPATKLIAEEYLKELKYLDIDTLILGCTHYPILTGIIREVMGDNVSLIDSGTAASLVVKEYLTVNELKNPQNKLGRHEFYVSDLPSKFKDIADRFLGREVEHLKKISLEELISH